MARAIRIQFHYDADSSSWWADSPDLERFTAAGETFDEVRREAREGVAFFAGEPVLVMEQGVPEKSPRSDRRREIRVVLSGSVLSATTAGGGGIPTVVLRAEGAGERVYREGAAIAMPEPA